MRSPLLWGAYDVLYASKPSAVGGPLTKGAGPVLAPGQQARQILEAPGSLVNEVQFKTLGFLPGYSKQFGEIKPLSGDTFLVRAGAGRGRGRLGAMWVFACRRGGVLGPKWVMTAGVSGAGAHWGSVLGGWRRAGLRGYLGVYIVGEGGVWAGGVLATCMQACRGFEPHSGLYDLKSVPLPLHLLLLLSDHTTCMLRD